MRLPLSDNAGGSCLLQNYSVTKERGTEGLLKYCNTGEGVFLLTLLSCIDLCDRGRGSAVMCACLLETDFCKVLVSPVQLIIIMPVWIWLTFLLVC
jgi:hypothetical protein